MTDPDRNQLAEELKALALRFLGKDVVDEGLWREAFRKAARFQRMAQQAATEALDRRRGPEYLHIQQLIADGELGGSKEADSVLEKRIRPRIPTTAELAKVREHFSPCDADSPEQLLERAVKAAKAAGIPSSRLPGTVLALFNWLDCFDDIKASRTLHWQAESPLFLCERMIIQPTNPPSIEDLKQQIDAATDEFRHRNSRDWS